MASLYRRHRPRTFADVVGQEHVVRTLRNAIEQDKVHHAYLFVGSRGTGKTSMAKILAASLNCVNGPTVTPDGTCESCVSIANATSLDVVEMDAASNNSVDDIRDLRERVAYAPVSGKYKVYILDEAHMLSTAAWNAFLKTLEEPPPNTIFVLATTEAAKVLPTVADRCHRFDFSRPTIAQIASVIRRVAEIEGITAPDEAVALMARSATGSFRDALGTLEQLVAYSGNTITLEDVLAVLGAADDELLFGTVDAIVASSARDALLAAARLADSGRDVTRFFGDLEGHLRSLMVVQTLGTVPAELSMTAETDERLADQARRAGPAQVTLALDLLSDAMRAMKDGADPRTQLELALVKAADPARDASQKALLARVERLERGGVQPAPAPHAPDVPATAAGQARAPQPAAAPAQAAAAPTPAVASAEVATAQAAATPAFAPAEAAPAQTAPAATPAQAADAREVGAPAPTQRAPAYDFGDPGPDDRHPDDLPPGPTGAPYGQPPASAPQPPAAAPQPPATAPPEPQYDEPAPVAVADGELDLAGFREIWPAVLQQMHNTPIGAFMAEAAPVACDGRAVTLAFSEANGLFQRQADRPANRDALKAAIRAVTGQAMQIKLEIRDEEELDIEEELVALSEDELIDRVVTEFDATVIDEGDTP